MAQLIEAYNPMQFDPAQGASNLPIGRHPVVIESDEVKANQANNGGYLQLNLRIIDGPHQGISGVERLNLYHSNSQTVEIANKTLSAICHVTGQFQLGPNGKDTSVLYNIPFIVEVGPQDKNPQYTEVKRHLDINGNEPHKGQGPAAAPAQQAAPAQAFAAPQQQQTAPAAQWTAAPAQQPAQQPQQAFAPPAQQQAPVQQPAAQWASPAQQAAPAANNWQPPAGQTAVPWNTPK